MFEDRMMAYYLKFLESKTTFSRADLMETIQENGKTISEASFKLELQKMLKEGICMTLFSSFNICSFVGTDNNFITGINKRRNHNSDTIV